MKDRGIGKSDKEKQIAMSNIYKISIISTLAFPFLISKFFYHRKTSNQRKSFSTVESI